MVVRSHYRWNVHSRFRTHRGYLKEWRRTSEHELLLPSSVYFVFQRCSGDAYHRNPHVILTSKFSVDTTNCTPGHPGFHQNDISKCIKMFVLQCAHACNGSAYNETCWRVSNSRRWVQLLFWRLLIVLFDLPRQPISSSDQSQTVTLWIVL